MEPFVVTTVEKDTSDAPVLIIDRRGIIGHAIYEKIKKELLTAFVSGKQPETSDQILHIPYNHRIPEIPNGEYAMIIFIADREKDLTELVKKCIAKAQEDAIPFIFIADRNAGYEHLLEKMVDDYEESYAIVYDEFFGQGNSLLDTYILQAGTTRTVKLPYMGLREGHPVLFDDAILGILQIIFGIQKRHRINFLYPQHVYTDLSIVHLLQKIDPLLHIDFLKEKKKSVLVNKPTRQVSHGAYFFDREYPTQEKIIAAYETVSSKRKTKEDAYIYKEEIKPLLNLQEEGSSFSLPEPVRTWGGLSLYYLFIIVIVPFLGLGISALIASSTLNTAKNNLAKGDSNQVKSQVAIAYNSFLFDETIKAPLLFELRIVGLGGLAQQLDTKISTGKAITQALGTLFVAEDSLNQVIAGTAPTPDAAIASIVSTARSAIVSVQKIQSEDPDEKDLLEKIGKYQNGIDMLSGTVGLLPHVFAATGKQTYLVLFQNNMELRPGGGFVGSYALITLDHGKMQDITIHNVYDADGQLRQHVDPPFAIRRFMGNVHLYLRDSTFDPDFIVDAQKASQMLQLETGQKVDGVMAVDLTFVKYLLSATGPLYVPQQNTTVNANNFFLLTEEHAEKNSFPGSTQKQDFLSNVFLALQNKLQSQKQVSMNTLVQKSLEAIEEKHLLFALANITDQNTLTANHLSSSLWDPRPQDGGTVNDYMGINEANIGVNKVNYFIKRTVKQAVSIDGDGTLKGKVQISYQNTSKPNEWPGGDYKNYLRIILPSDTTLTGISFDGQTQATRSAITEPLIYEAQGFVPPTELEVEQTQEQGKNLYGFLVTIPASSTKTVEINYEHNEKINLGNPVLHYSLSLYKQPGTNNDSYSFAFNFPLEYSILSADPANGDGNSDYTLDTKLSEDKTISVDLTKK